MFIVDREHCVVRLVCVQTELNIETKRDLLRRAMIVQYIEFTCTIMYALFTKHTVRAFYFHFVFSFRISSFP